MLLWSLPGSEAVTQDESAGEWGRIFSLLLIIIIIIIIIPDEFRVPRIAFPGNPGQRGHRGANRRGGA